MSLPAKEFSNRRRALMERMAPNSIAILASAPVRIRNRDVDYLYRQESDFHYLSGFVEPESVLVLLPDREQGRFLLFCRERNPERELWDGYRCGPERAPELYGADDAFPITDIDDILPGLIEGRDHLYYTLGRDAEFDRRLIDWVNQVRGKVRSGAHPPDQLIALEHLLHDLRLYKSPAELKLMREAGAISARAHVRAMQVCRPGLWEYQLEAELLHEFIRSGSRAPAYSSIVGSGPNSCILHYRENNRQMADGELVLIDAGCEFEHYASDITRTFPVNGTFSGEQRALYEVVLTAQQAAIDATRPGASWNQPHDASVRVITEGLLALGLLSGELNELIETEACKPYYMHRAGHWLGMDVHDVGEYKVAGAWRMLEPGMTMTVEPGIYVALNQSGIDPRWRGIGIRIEDDVAVTRNGVELLTPGVPKQIDEIEALMAEARGRQP